MASDRIKWPRVAPSSPPLLVTDPAPAQGLAGGQARAGEGHHLAVSHPPAGVPGVADEGGRVHVSKEDRVPPCQGFLVLSTPHVPLNMTQYAIQLLWWNSALWLP